MLSGAKISENFSRIAYTYERYADIQSQLGDELLRKIIQEEGVYGKILDIGCGTGNLAKALSKYFLKTEVFGLDISFEMAKIARLKSVKSLASDAQILPFKDMAFDLIVSNATYQWVNDAETAFSEAKRALAPYGIFIFNCFGHATLRELRSCFQIKENFLPTEDSLVRNLRNAGFKDIQISVESRYKYFDCLKRILYWLKNIGANSIYPRPYFLTPQKLRQAEEAYHNNFRNNGNIYATFEVIWVKAQKRE